MFEPLLAKYLNEFTIKGEPVLKALINSDVPSKIVLLRYDRFPEHQKIEFLSQQQKNELWSYAKELSPNADSAEWLRIAKLVYTIGTLL
jgi:hypothetical protein